MKKRISLFLYLLTTSLISGAQNKITDNLSVINVVYSFYHIDDLNNPKDAIQQEMILRISPAISKYYNHEKVIALKKSLEQAHALAAQSTTQRLVYRGTPRAVVYSDKYIDNIIIQNSHNNILYNIETIGNKDYLMEYPIPEIKWEIINEKKKIGNFSAQKAQGSYAGRIYTVWFSTEIPFKYGPWKLSGLPGLILEAEDSKGEVKFRFKEIYKEEEPYSIEFDKKKYIKIQDNQFEKLKAVYIKDPVSTYASTLSSNTPTPSLAYIDENGKMSDAKQSTELLKKNNQRIQRKKVNPLELK